MSTDKNATKIPQALIDLWNEVQKNPLNHLCCKREPQVKPQPTLSQISDERLREYAAQIVTAKLASTISDEQFETILNEGVFWLRKLIEEVITGENK